MQAECSHQSTAQLPAAQSRRLRPLCKKLDPDDRNAREQHSIFCRRLVASKNNGESNRCFGPIGRIRPESHSPCTISCFSSVAAPVIGFSFDSAVRLSHTAVLLRDIAVNSRAVQLRVWPASLGANIKLC